MYLRNLKIKNFRLAKETEITFQKGLNILIGPNNAGKTTIIDAIRICLNYGNQYNVRVKKEDFNDINKEIEFNLFFEIDEEIESAIFLELFNPQTNSLEITFKYNYNEIYDRVYSEVRGVNKENSIPNELFQFIYNINLDALRDANRFLSPGRYNIISDFFKEAINENEQKEIMEEINNFISKSEANKLINKYKNKDIQDHLKSLSLENEEDKLIVSPIDQEFDEFTKKLKIQIENSSNKILDLNQNGLGYNNLIYISVLLSHLNTINDRTDETIYTSLCIEEPEAHLHPQLEKLLFTYLNQLNKENKKNKLQIFITTHSPTLTSKANLDSLIMVKNNNNIESLTLKDSKLEKENKIYLEKFLDVTKSQLLFSKSVIFVEGISEEILIPILAEQEGIDLDKKGIELVNVNGITFKHFAPLFDKEYNLIERGVILTDGDEKELNGPQSDTCQQIKKLSENNNIKVFVSKKTFEFDLLNNNEKNSIIWEKFKKKHSQKFNDEMSEEKLFNEFNKKNSNIKKSEIAYNIAIELKKNSEKIKIPKYIEDALYYIKEEK